ncbi:MAG: EAL domain-containing protein [Eubacterium sp.]|nr:EAL domain-containing protein [Eubacterium sp.]
MFDNSFALGVSCSALLICIVNLIYTFIQKRTDKTHNKIFVAILCILSINAINGIISGAYGDDVTRSDISFTITQVSRYAYFVTHTALCPLFFYYVCNVSFVSNRMSSLKAKLIFMPFILTELMALTNPLTHLVYKVDSDLKFQRQWGEIFIYLAALLYFVLAFAVFRTSWKFISGKRKPAMVFLFILVAVGVFMQLLDKNLKVEVLFEAVGFTGVMLSVENEDDRIDFGMGFYNRAALNLDIGSSFRHNRKLNLIILKLNNYDLIDRLIGNGETNTIADIISGYLTSHVKRYHIYVSEKNTFVMTLYDKDKESVDKLAEEIAARFEEPWDYKDFSVLFNSTVMVADIPNQIKSASEMFYMLDSPALDDNEKNLLKDEDLNFIMRRRAVEDAISRGFAENSYEVYYQPTFRIDGELHGAEALVRLFDKKLGSLYPDEFIPIAEQSGLIDDIDDFVLEEVCRFLGTGIPRKYNIDHINVNLSVIQCMRPRFVETIDEIVERNGIDKKLINFEITETIAASDYETLSKIIERLKDEGFMFSMDDYGTGYSNMSAVFSLDLDVVKIDKSILWGAEKSELGMVILENTIRMIQQMKKKILVEGVETVDHIKLLKKLQVDYLQGFYFSKPITKEEFIDFISDPLKKEFHIGSI